MGLCLAVLFILQGLTGATLVFRDRLLVGLNRQLLTSGRLAPIPAVDRILQTVDQQFGAPVVDRVVFPRGDRTAAMVYLPTGRASEQRIIASDARTGRVLGEIAGLGKLPFVVFRLHDELLIGNVGHAIGLIEGLGLLFLCVSGFVLARPRQTVSWRLRWQGTRLERRFDLHRVAGLSLVPFLAFSAATGIILQIDFLSTAGAPSRLVTRLLHPNWSSLMAQVDRLSRTYHSEAIEDIRISADQGRATIALYTDEVARPLALDRVTVDLTTGKIVELQRAAQETRGRSFLAWIYPLHSGKAFGSIQPILLLFSFGLFALPLFGILLWHARLPKRPARAPARPEI